MLVEIESLKPNPRNPNKHSKEQIERLAKLIRYQGFRVPVIVSNQSGFIVSGHGRVEAARLLGMEQVPVVYQDFIDEAQEYAFLTSDNAIASWSELDIAGITDIAATFDDFDLELLGIKDFKLPDFQPGTEDDQGRLDQKQLKFITCPHCDEEFELGQAKGRGRCNSDPSAPI